MVLTGKLLQKLFVFKPPIEIIHINCLVPEFFVVVEISDGGVEGQAVKHQQLREGALGE